MAEPKTTPSDISDSTTAEIGAWYSLRHDHHRKIYPDDPKPDLGYLVSRALALHNTQQGLAWAAWSEEGEMLAWCRAHVSRSGFFPESATFGITAKRPHRRKGLGTALLGISEILWNPATPQILKQGYTAVLPDYRGRGIGKRLKAGMIRRIREEIPEAGVIRTGNFDKRKAILGINSALGYKRFITQHGWMVTTEKVRDYLSGGR